MNATITSQTCGSISELVRYFLRLGFISFGGPVGGADTSRHDLAVQCGGLFAISLRLSANFPDDHAMLRFVHAFMDAVKWASAERVLGGFGKP